MNTESTGKKYKKKCVAQVSDQTTQTIMDNNFDEDEVNKDEQTAEEQEDDEEEDEELEQVSEEEDEEKDDPWEPIKEEVLERHKTQREALIKKNSDEWRFTGSSSC